jgi:hypothetical protein
MAGIIDNDDLGLDLGLEDNDYIDPYLGLDIDRRDDDSTTIPIVTGYRVHTKEYLVVCGNLQSWEIESEENKAFIQTFRQNYKTPFNTERHAFPIIISYDKDTNEYVFRRDEREISEEENEDNSLLIRAWKELRAWEEESILYREESNLSKEEEELVNQGIDEMLAFLKSLDDNDIQIEKDAQAESAFRRRDDQAVQRIIRSSSVPLVHKSQQFSLGAKPYSDGPVQRHQVLTKGIHQSQKASEVQKVPPNTSKGSSLSSLPASNEPSKATQDDSQDQLPGESSLSSEESKTIRSTSSIDIQIPRADRLEVIIADYLAQKVDQKSLLARLAGQMKAKLWKRNLISGIKDLENTISLSKSYNSCMQSLARNIHRKLLERKHPVMVDYNPAASIIRIEEIIASASSDIICSVIRGDISERYHRPGEKDFRENLSYISNGNLTPSIYINTLVNKLDGTPPLISHAREMSQYAQRYITDDQLALDVDKIVGKKGYHQSAERSGSGLKYRRYFGEPLTDKKLQANRPQNRKDKLLEFLTDFDNALDEMEKINGPNGYMTRPLTEVGYATNPAERLAQHQSHNSSNFLMNLFESICLVFLKDYVNEQYVIYNCWAEHQGAIGEIVFAELSQCFTWTGTGFSHVEAGVSTGKIRGVNYDKWYNIQLSFMKYGPLLQNYDNQTAYLTALKKIDDQITDKEDKMKGIRRKALKDAMTTIREVTKIFDREIKGRKKENREIQLIRNLLTNDSPPNDGDDGDDGDGGDGGDGGD